MREDYSNRVKPTRKTKSWLDKKLANPRFRERFEEEYHRLSIAEQIVRLRLQAGLTQAEVAKRAGTTASAISRYELQTLRKIAGACGGRLEVVLRGRDDTDRAA
ncbi:MAG: helix-turn-helix transcriptional regulator [Deltaproteobacteria bacterium]|nr:helix-turn-helix transcriptional regulator [Deltaproteobacteria bacterium]